MPAWLRVAESGIQPRRRRHALADAGFDAVLVGESLVTAGDPGAAVAGLRSAGGRSGARPGGADR